MNKLFAALLSVFACGSAFAGQSYGTVTTPLSNEQGAFFFSAGSATGKPACAVQTLGYWAVNTTTAGGKAMAATVLAAYANGKTIQVAGKGVCDVWNDRESVSWLYIVN
jgi:hypothetical protein